MNYLPMMTDDEIKDVCSAIPLKNLRVYFKRNVKEFHKIKHGFRPTSLTQEQVNDLLFQNQNNPFISSIIENHISDWLDKIAVAIKEKIEEGENKESALLQILSHCPPHCPFVENVGLYFKLTDEKHAKEYILMVSVSIRLLRDADTKRERVQSKMGKKTEEINSLEKERESLKAERDKIGQKMSECLDENKTLRQSNADFEADLKKRNETISAHEKTIEKLRKKEEEQKEYIEKQSAELSSAKNQLSLAENEQKQLEQKIKEELERQREAEKYRQDSARKSKCPQDLDEFRAYLGYNLENIGVATNSYCYPLLKDHLGEILFQGKPVIISRRTGLSLMKCVSNTLVETPTVPVLEFLPDITERVIDVFLSQDKRILCLDNFIGNYNETMLITICDRHKDKIIFLTVAYDHTLCFVPDELMRYCHYLNLNRIEAFVGDRVLTEDSSVVDEIETVVASITPDARWSPALKEMLDELGVQSALSVYKSSLVADEQSLCRLLAFDILPYCTDVLKIAPFNRSEQLVKYADDRGRCRYKDLFKKWFA